MRNLFSCLAVVMTVAFIGCGEPTSTVSTDAAGDMTNVSINVPGMT